MNSGFVDIMNNDYIEHFSDFWKCDRTDTDEDGKYLIGLMNFDEIEGFTLWWDVPLSIRDNVNSLIGPFDDRDNIVGMIDTTLFKSGKTGLVFTSNGIYIRRHLGMKDYISYSDLFFSYITACKLEQYESYVHDDNISKTFNAGAKIYQTTFQFKKSFFRYYRNHILKIMKGIISEIFNNIRNGNLSLAENQAARYSKIFIQIKEYELIDIAVSALIIANLANGNIKVARQNAEAIPSAWLSKNIDKYIKIYNHYRWEELLAKADNLNAHNEKLSALNTFEDALSFCEAAPEFERVYKGILDIYYDTADKENLFNVDSYTNYLKKLKEINTKSDDMSYYQNRRAELRNKLKEYAAKLHDDMSEIVKNENCHYIEQFPSLIDNTDKYGMNLFLYAILYNKPSFLKYYDNHITPKLLNAKNIWDLDYLCMAAIQSQNSGYKYFTDILDMYDDEYKQRKDILIKQLDKLDIKSMGIGMINSLLNTLNENAKSNYGDEYNSAAMDTFIGTASGKSNDYDAQKRQIIEEFTSGYPRDKYNTAQNQAKSYLRELSNNGKYLPDIFLKIDNIEGIIRKLSPKQLKLLQGKKKNG